MTKWFCCHDRVGSTETTPFLDTLKRSVFECSPMGGPKGGVRGLPYICKIRNFAAATSKMTNQACTRRRSRLNQVAVLMCIPAVFCSIPKVLGDCGGDNVQSKSQLRRCVSLSSCMNQDAQNLNSIGCKRRIPVYSPVHSPPTELAHDQQPLSRECKPRNSNIDLNYLHLALQERRECPTEVYTKIQTQLYPGMRF
jgi:hypothetical protein